jgi:hypothetical protein
MRNMKNWAVINNWLIALIRVQRIDLEAAPSLVYSVSQNNVSIDPAFRSPVGKIFPTGDLVKTEHIYGNHYSN